MKLIPASAARRKTARLCSRSSTQERHVRSPKPIAPRPMRETFRPARPSRTYSIPSASSARLPQTAEARNLVGNPLEALHRRSQGGVFRTEQQRHHRQIGYNLLLRIGIELLAFRDVVHRTGLIEQR